MTNRIPKLFIYSLVLIAVLGIGVWLGRSGISNPSISKNRQQATDISGNVNAKDSIVNKSEEKKTNDNNKTNDIQSVEPSSINSIRSVKVKRVLDGDTIEIEGGERVRYLGINAPESGQPFSTEATRENERLVAGRAVNLEFDIQTQDRYGRLLAHIWVGDVLVNK